MDISYILSKEVQQQGLSLHDLGDHILELRLKGKPVALFNQTKVELKTIHHHAELICKN